MRQATASAVSIGVAHELGQVEIPLARRVRDPTGRCCSASSTISAISASVLLAAPSLIVHGRDDKVIPLDTSLRLLHVIDRSQLHVFGRCGHWTQIERAGDFVRLVDDFLSH